METVWYSTVELMGCTQLKFFIQLFLIELAVAQFLSPSETLITVPQPYV